MQLVLIGLPCFYLVVKALELTLALLLVEQN